jgi:hypothetical protein
MDATLYFHRHRSDCEGRESTEFPSPARFDFRVGVGSTHELLRAEFRMLTEVVPESAISCKIIQESRGLTSMRGHYYLDIESIFIDTPATIESEINSHRYPSPIEEQVP